MEVLVLDTSLTAVAILDTFDSLIWTDRYFKYGDFEVCTAVTNNALNVLREDYYLVLNGSDHVMIIEGLEIKTNNENGNTFLVSGRSLESILERRVIWKQTILHGDFQNGVQRLLNENVIAPSDPNRTIHNFIFEASTDPAITDLVIDAQYTGDNLYTAIQGLCEANNIGFKITLSDDGFFVFKLYSGVDRSYNQLVIPYVVFSPKFENILNSNYVESKKALKTIALVAGEGEGSDRKTTSVEIPSGGGSDLARRELFIDARDISSTVDSGTLTPEEYAAQLSQRGIENLISNIFVKSFDGQIETTRLYKYGTDFFMGDIIQIANEYDMETEVRVVELIHSQNSSGIEIYPTFITV